MNAFNAAVGILCNQLFLILGDTSCALPDVERLRAMICEHKNVVIVTRPSLVRHVLDASVDMFDSTSTRPKLVKRLLKGDFY